MSVVFVSPVERRTGFFVNPHRFERLFLDASAELDTRNSAFQLFDTCDPREHESCLHEVVVLDVPVGSWPDSVRRILTTYKATAGYVVVGDTVTDGYFDQLPADAHDLSIFDRPIKAIPRHDKAQVVQAIIALKQAAHNRADEGTPIQKESASPLDSEFVDVAARTSSEIGFQYFLPGLSSGCEEHCTFCRLCNRADTKGVVTDLQRDPVDVMLTVSERYGLRSFQFTDENFLGGASPISRIQRLQAVSDLSSRISRVDRSWVIGIDTRCDSIIDIREDAERSAYRRKVLEEFRVSGWSYVYLGVESFSQSQLKRYAKRLSVENVFAAIDACRSLGVEFTLGAIWFDPLVQPHELRASTQAVKNNDLYGHIGPIFKEMRVQILSPYGRLYEQLFSSTQIDRVSENLVYIDPENVQYASVEVSSILRAGRLLQSMMSRAGYRHSDIAFLRVLLSPLANTQALQRIPYLVSRREVELLEFCLSSHKEISDGDAEVLALRAAKATAADIEEALGATASSPDVGLTRVRDYFSSVMRSLHRQVGAVEGRSA